MTQAVVIGAMVGLLCGIPLGLVCGLIWERSEWNKLIRRGVIPRPNNPDAIRRVEGS
jgi:hypothetical protein